MRITERDRELLKFVADHRLVVPAHIQALLGVSAAAAYARLRALRAAGLLTHECLFHREPACYRITRRGLALVGSELSQSRVDLRSYQHDVGVAWLWLAARSGAFGLMNEILAERQLRSHDGTPDGSSDPLGVRLGGVGPGGRERLHYPDLLLRTATGARIAVELELSSKGRARRERILAGYGADERIDAVLYLVDKPHVARAIGASAAALGLSRLVHVQQVRRPSAERQGMASAVSHRAHQQAAGGRFGQDRPVGREVAAR